jgi:hypothetical protein
MSQNEGGMSNNNKECDVVRGDGDLRGFHWNVDKRY